MTSDACPCCLCPSLLRPSTAEQHLLNLHSWETICQSKTAFHSSNNFPSIHAHSLSLNFSISSTHLFPLLCPTCCVLLLSYRLALAISAPLSPDLPIVSFVELLASPAHFPTQAFEQTLIQSHWQAHRHTEDHAISVLSHFQSDSSAFILPLFLLFFCRTVILSVKQPNTWERHPDPETMFYLIVSTWLRTHTIQYAAYGTRWMEWL